MTVSKRKAALVLVALIGLVGALFVPASAEDSIGSAEVNESAPGTIGEGARLAAGFQFTCVLGDDTSVWCWGDTGFGQLGSGAGVDTHVPQEVGTGFVSISAGAYHACGVTTTGGVKCWGRDLFGEAMGTGVTGTTVLTPVAIPGISTAVNVAAGFNFTCATLANGTVQCWGDTSEKRMGRSTTGSSAAPGPVDGISTAITVTAGDYHACAVLADGTVMCWGDNDNGQLGRGDLDANGLTAELVQNWSVGQNLTGIAGVSAGAVHTCAVRTDGATECWGNNGHSQVGYAASNVPHLDASAVVLTITNTGFLATGVAVGDNHSCAVLSAGVVSCWGSNSAEQLNGAPSNLVYGSIQPPRFPVAEQDDIDDDRFVSGVTTGYLDDIMGVSAGGAHTCVIMDTGAVRCWGDNSDGQAGHDNFALTDRFSVGGLPTITFDFDGDGVTDEDDACPLKPNPCVDPTPTPTSVPPTPTPTATPTPHVPSGTSNSFVIANLEELEAGPGEIRVHGWAYDPDLPSKDLVVHVYAFFDGVGDPVALGTPVVRAADFRPDINRAFTIEGDHGFNRSLKIRNGNHRVCVYSLSVDGAGDLDDLNRLIGCRYVTVTDEAPPRGAFDIAAQTGTSLKVSGWAYDLDRENDSIDIQVFLDGAFFKTIKANTSRPDVNKIVQISGDHGFNSTFTVPAGGHTVCLYAIGVDPTGAADGENVLLNVIDKPDCRTT